MLATAYITTYTPTEPATPAPPCAASGNISPKIPIGAAATTQRTSTSIASARARKKPRSVSREAGGLFAVATASSRANSTSETMLPLAAAATGLVGMSETSHGPNPTVCPLEAT